jgi:TolA-binding protein
MSENVDVKLARVEEKIDAMNEKIDMVLSKNNSLELKIQTVESSSNTRIQNLERRMDKHGTWFSIFGWVGGAIWAVVLIILARVFNLVIK